MKNNLKMDLSFVTKVDNDSIAIRFIPSGWCKPRRYHTIKEYGDYEDTEYLGLFDRDQIRENFSIDIPDEWDLSRLIKQNPNDCSLGKSLREINSKLK